MSKINIFTDGACEPNPGVGGWAVVVFRDGAEIETRSGGDSHSTNNVMEMTAVLVALEYAALAKLDPTQVTIHSDSMYCVKGCNEWRHKWKKSGWKRGEKPLANCGLWKAIAEAHDAFPCKISWVRGHSGILGNERADELAEMARQRVVDRMTDLIQQCEEVLEMVP